MESEINFYRKRRSVEQQIVVVDDIQEGRKKKAAN
jgi:hypothetical protein